jgi:ribokinase
MIVVFGSINIDLVFVLAALPRSGETVLGPSYSVVAGGKGANQALAAARDGGARRAGGRGRRRRLRRAGTRRADAGGHRPYLPRARVSTDRLCRDRCRPGGRQPDHRRERRQSPRARRSGAGRMARPRHDVVVQREVPMAELATLLPRARARGARVVLNVAPAGPVPPEALAAVDVLVANEGEAEALARAHGLADADPAALARALGCAVVVTRGGEGAIAAGGGAVLRIGALAITPVDTTAAGDCFVGVLAAALDRGATLGPALHRASVAAALACTKAGAQPSLPLREAIDARLGDLAAAT